LPLPSASPPPLNPPAENAVARLHLVPKTPPASQFLPTAKISTNVQACATSRMNIKPVEAFAPSLLRLARRGLTVLMTLELLGTAA